MPRYLRPLGPLAYQYYRSCQRTRTILSITLFLRPRDRAEMRFLSCNMNEVRWYGPIRICRTTF